MSALLGATLLVVGFLLVFRVLNLGAKASAAIALSRQALFEIGRRDTDDEAKEKALRSSALALIRLSGILILGGVAAAGLPALVVWGLDRLGLVSFESVMEVAVSWEFLIAAAVLTTIVFWLWGRRKSAEKDVEGGFENRYSSLGRTLHYVAFATTSAQIAVADWEDRWLAKQKDASRVRDPVFITALPRAGTTLLLDLCARTGSFATHSYRHMPFLFTPVFWHRFTRGLSVTQKPKERAHGDGMLINEDSPEAFEEMLWLAFWPEHYRRDRIKLWPREANDEFLTFFRRHQRKIVLLDGSGESPTPARYLSKNNLNIARIAWLADAFPSARFLIPFRHPLQQAASLLRQHKNFLAIHAADSFARHYMAAIGHFDFGANLRPVNFGGWLERDPRPQPTELAYWLLYWIAAYGHLIGQIDDRVMLLDYDRFCREPGTALKQVAGFLDLEDGSKLVGQQSRVRQTEPRPIDVPQTARPLLDQALELHRHLSERSLSGWKTRKAIS